MNAKSLVACAALLMGVAFVAPQASAAGVQSDVVGYTTVKMEAGKWYQIGSPFTALKDGAKQTITEVFGSGFSSGDTLYFFDNTKGQYTHTMTWDSFEGQTGWFESLDDVETTKKTIEPGTAVFIQKAVTGTVTLAGKVDAKAVTSVGSDLGNHWSMVVFQYPTATAIKDIKWSTSFANNDMLYIFDAKLQRYTNSLVYLADEGYPVGWYDSAEDVDLSNVVIQPGQALFIHKVSPKKGSLQK